MSDKQLSLGQSSQRRFARTGASRVLVHQQTITNVTQTRKVRTQSHHTKSEQVSYQKIQSSPHHYQIMERQQQSQIKSHNHSLILSQGPNQSHLSAQNQTRTILINNFARSVSRVYLRKAGENKKILWMKLIENSLKGRLKEESVKEFQKGKGKSQSTARLSTNKKQHQTPMSNNNQDQLHHQLKEFKDLALSSQLRQALIKFQKYHRSVYERQFQQQIGRLAKAELVKIQKYKNSKRESRGKDYDNQLLLTVLQNHIKLFKEHHHQIEQLTKWKSRQVEEQNKQKKVKVEQGDKKTDRSLNSKDEKEVKKQQEIIEKHLIAKQYSLAKSSINSFLKKIEKESSLELSEMAIMLMNRVRVLIDDWEKATRSNFQGIIGGPPTDHKALDKQRAKSLQYSKKIQQQISKLKKYEARISQLQRISSKPPLPHKPNKQHQQRSKQQHQQRLKQQQSLQSLLSSKNYSVAKNSILAYLSRHEIQQTTTQITTVTTLLKHVNVLIEEYQKVGKEENAKHINNKKETIELQNENKKLLKSVEELKIQIEKERKKFEELQKGRETRKTDEWKEKEVKKQREVYFSNLDDKNYHSAKNNINMFVKKYEKEEFLTLEVNLLTHIRVLIDENQRMQKTNRESSGQRQIAKLKSENQRLNETLQKERTQVNRLKIDIDKKNKEILTNLQSHQRLQPLRTPEKSIKTEAQIMTPMRQQNRNLIQQLRKQIQQLKKQNAAHQRQTEQMRKELHQRNRILQQLNLRLTANEEQIKTEREHQRMLQLKKEADRVRTQQKDSADKDSMRTPGKTPTKSLAEIGRRDREMKRQRELIDGHLRDRHYYYAKPMLISFLKNFSDVQGWEEVLKYYNYFLGIIDDVELARHEIKEQKQAPKQVANKEKQGEKQRQILKQKEKLEQQLRAIQKELKEVRIVLTQREQTIIQTTTYITKVLEMRQNNQQWWQKVPRRSGKLPQNLSVVYKLVDSWRQQEIQNKKNIEKLQRQLKAIQSNQDQMAQLTKILRAIQNIVRKKEFMGTEKDPWAELFKGVNAKKDMLVTLHRILNALLNQAKTKLVAEKKNYQISQKNYQKHITTLTTNMQTLEEQNKELIEMIKKQQQMHQKLKKDVREARQEQKQRQVKSQEQGSQTVKEKDQSWGEDYKAIQEYINQQKRMLKRLQQLQNQKERANEKFKSLEVRYKQSTRDLSKTARRIKQLEQTNTKLNTQINNKENSSLNTEQEKRQLRENLEKDFQVRQAGIRKEFEIQKKKITDSLLKEFADKQKNIRKEIADKEKELGDRERTLKKELVDKEKQSEDKQRILKKDLVDKEKTLRKQIEDKDKEFGEKEKVIRKEFADKDRTLRKQFEDKEKDATERERVLRKQLGQKEREFIEKDRLLRKELIDKERSLRKQFEQERKQLNREWAEQEKELRKGFDQQRRERNKEWNDQEKELRKEFESERKVIRDDQVNEFRAREERLIQQVSVLQTERETFVRQRQTQSRQTQQLVGEMQSLRQQLQNFKQNQEQTRKSEQQAQQIHSKLFKMQEELIRYRRLVETKEAEIKELHTSIETKIGDSVSRALRQQEKDFNNLSAQNQRKREEHIQTVLKERKQQWRIEYVSFAQNLSRVTKPIDEVTINISKFDEQKLKTQMLWKGRLQEKERQFQERLSRATVERGVLLVQKEAEWRRIIESRVNEAIREKQQEFKRVILEKEREWVNNVLEVRVTEERTRILRDKELQLKALSLERDGNDSVNINRRIEEEKIRWLRQKDHQLNALLLQKEREWNKSLVYKIQQQRARVLRQKEQQHIFLLSQKQQQWNQILSIKISQQKTHITRQKQHQFKTILLQKEREWNSTILSKDSQWSLKLSQQIQYQRSRANNDKSTTETRQKEQITLLKQIIENQKEQLREMKILLERVGDNRGKQRSVGAYEELEGRYRRLQMEQIKGSFQLKMEYQVKMGALQKEVLMLQERSRDTQHRLGKSGTRDETYKWDDNVKVIELQRQKTLLESTLQTKEAENTYIKRTFQSLDLQLKQTKVMLSQFRGKATQAQNLMSEQQSRYLQLQHQVKLLRDRQRSLLKQFEINQQNNSQLRRSFEHRIAELNAESQHERRDLVQLTRENECLRRDLHSLEGQQRKSESEQRSTEVHRLRQILRQVEIQKQKHLAVNSHSKYDETQMQVLGRINIQVGELVETNRHLQMKVILLQNESSLLSSTSQVINFFLMLQHRLDSLMSFLQQSGYADLVNGSQIYTAFLARSRQSLREARIQQYFDQFYKLMKALFKDIWESRQYQIQAKGKQLKELKGQMAQVMDKQIQLNEESVNGSRVRYQNGQLQNGTHHHHTHENQLREQQQILNDLKYLLKEYIRGRDQECLGVVCRTMGVQM